jgi:hypothetical protein
MVNNINGFNHERTAFYTLTILSTLFLFYILYITDSNYTFDESDGVWHYLIPRYSYLNPSFELDLWAKPVFTIIAAPFAQFGLKGIHFMQILCTFSTNILLYKIASHFNVKHLWLIPILLIFTPVYFPIIFSGLTEILFALILVGGICLVVKDEWLFATLLFSFLPFARQEGYFIFPLIGTLLILQKKYFCIPLLFCGYIVITIYGYSTYHNLAWIINRNPYKGAEDIYGKGDFFFYIDALEHLLGTSRKLLFYIGSAFSLISIGGLIYSYKNTSFFKDKIFHFNFLTLGFIVAFILAESIFWHFGLFGALGMHRLIVCIVPLIVLIIIFGINHIDTYAHKFNIQKVFLALLILWSVFFVNIVFKQYYWPLELRGESKSVSKAGNWISEHVAEKRKIIYSHPFVITAMSLNPYDSKKCAELFIVEDKAMPEKNINTGDLVIWDSHYSPNECKLPLSNLLLNKSFKLLHKVEHASAPLSNETLFEVYIFERI